MGSFSIEIQEAQAEEANTRPLRTVQLVFLESDNSELADRLTKAHVHHLRVAYDMRGKGVGSRLIDRAEQYAREREFHKLTLVVDDWKAEAIDFYEKRGYEAFKQTNGEEAKPYW